VRSSLRRSSLTVTAVLGMASCTGLALAHEPFSVTTEARALREALTLHVTMAGRTATLACPGAAGEPHRLTPQDLARARQPFEACAKGLYVVTSAGHRLEPRFAMVALTEEGDFDARVTYPAALPGPLTLEAVHLARLPDPMYGAELTVTGERVFLGQALLRAPAPSFTAAVPIAEAASPEPTPHVPTFAACVRLGVEHLLGGYDHLALLVGLLAVSRRFTRVLAVLAAFTLAHSLTLVLATLGGVRLPARLLEPLIAATVVLVAAENLRHPDDGPGRWALTFAFGLVHGLGFASALAQAGVGRNGAPLALPLIGFNLGVDVGQVALAALVVPALGYLRRFPAFERYGTRLLSAAVGALGLAWLGARLMPLSG
jgi:hypothetical protein